MLNVSPKIARESADSIRTERFYPANSAQTHVVPNCKRQLGQLMDYHKEGIEIGVHDMLSRAIKINGKAAERMEY